MSDNLDLEALDAYLHYGLPIVWWIDLNSS